MGGFVLSNSTILFISQHDPHGSGQLWPLMNIDEKEPEPIPTPNMVLDACVGWAGGHTLLRGVNYPIRKVTD